MEYHLVNDNGGLQTAGDSECWYIAGFQYKCAIIVV